jgi:hypothetical protein
LPSPTSIIIGQQQHRGHAKLMVLALTSPTAFIPSSDLENPSRSNQARVFGQIQNPVSQTLGVSSLVLIRRLVHSVVDRSRSELLHDGCTVRRCGLSQLHNAEYPRIISIDCQDCPLVRSYDSSFASSTVDYCVLLYTCPLYRPGQFTAHTPVIPRKASTRTGGVSEIADASNSTPQKATLKSDNFFGPQYRYATTVTQ